MPSMNDLLRIIQDPERLQTLRELDILDTEAEPAFDRLTTLASRLLDAPISLVSLVDGERQWAKSYVGLDEDDQDLPLSHSICKHVVGTNEPLIVGDAPNHPLLKDHLAVRDYGVIAYAGIPLTLKNGQTLGSFCVIDTAPRQWSETERGILEDLTAAVITELELRLEVQKRQQAEADLRQHTESLEQMNAELRAYNHTVAHDLRSPLGIISGVFEIIMEIEQDKLSDYSQRALGSGLGAVDKMNQIISSLLMLAEVRDKDIPLKAVPMDEVISETLKRFTFELKDISLDIHSPLPTVYGHAPWVEEVMANLISNAIKYIGVTNDDPTIRITGESDGTHAYTHVIDNGIGISEENQTRLGQLFTRFNEDEAAGTGLGLSIVLRILRRLNGRLKLESTPGEGATFTVVLPIPKDNSL